MDYGSNHPQSSLLSRYLALLLAGLVAVAATGAAEEGPERLPELLLPEEPWTNEMLEWQRTAFHFQPQKNWMNDPNAPLVHKGWYHLFYQHSRDSVTWGVGNMSWGHAVSRDLVHWLHLPYAMVPNRRYDTNGVWSGSATVLPNNNNIVIIYTGITEEWTQVQNVAVPANQLDPLLIDWVKLDANPVLEPPAHIGPRNFRDPSTAWFVEAQSKWRVAIGAINGSTGAGVAFVYETADFVDYELMPGLLHEVAGMGMWECIDFYPISTATSFGLHTSVGPGEGVKHVIKASVYDQNMDHYAIGEYDVERNVWVPDDPEADVGFGLVVDYGNYYASKTFYDEVKERRVVLGWINETDSKRNDFIKGWASVQAIPRTLLFDRKTGRNLLIWPVEEVESLRYGGQEFRDVGLAPGSALDLHVNEAGQLDIMAEFEIGSLAMGHLAESDLGYTCNSSGGASGRGALGPFGLLVLADDDRIEQTAVFFYVGWGSDGSLRTFFCQDELRSSEASDVRKSVYGSVVPVLDGENLSVRILVDHSVVESFAQGGRACITSRVYPTKAIYGAARVFLFNNATEAQVTAKSVKIWRMDSAFIRAYRDEYGAQA